MSDLDDFDYNRPRRTPEATEPDDERGARVQLDAGDEGEPSLPGTARAEGSGDRPAFPVGAAAGAVGLLALVGVTAYIAFRPARPAPAPSPAAVAPTPAVTSSPTPEPSAAPPEPVALPALDQSDALVRDLLRGLSSDTQLGGWLQTGDLVRRFVAAAANVAAGENPRAHLFFLGPRERFSVRARDGRVWVDPGSHARYDGVARAFGALDARGCAHMLRLLAPLLDAAHRELGRPPGSFDATLRAALQALLQVPVTDGEVELRPVTRVVLLYQYADPRLESLSAPQKQLLRFGPANVRRVQSKLREIQEHLDPREPAAP